MENEEIWQNTTSKIIKTIDSLEVDNEKENFIKVSIEYLLIKMCESEEIFNDNLLILDRYASNGIAKKTERKMNR